MLKPNELHLSFGSDKESNPSVMVLKKKNKYCLGEAVEIPELAQYFGNQQLAKETIVECPYLGDDYSGKDYSEEIKENQICANANTDVYDNAAIQSLFLRR